MQQATTVWFQAARGADHLKHICSFFSITAGIIQNWSADKLKQKIIVFLFVSGLFIMIAFS